RPSRPLPRVRLAGRAPAASDGRRQRRACRREFTPRPGTSKLRPAAARTACAARRSRARPPPTSARTSRVYSDGLNAYDKLHLAGSRHTRVDRGTAMGRGRTHIDGAENFWGFAKRRLKMYHGGWKRNFRLSVREMEFRFDHRRTRDPVDVLQRLLKRWSGLLV
ncbi:MAG TPA: transposase, partial [Tepidisphaeraceae bacterium]|nr:transposase [Tepidisphaeraceae bacterium]